MQIEHALNCSTSVGAMLLLELPPAFAHQVSGHSSGIGFRAHRRQRSADGKVASSDSPSALSMQPTVLKPVPLHAPKGARELAFYERLEQLRQYARSSPDGVVQPPSEWSSCCRCNLAQYQAAAQLERPRPSLSSDARAVIREWLSFLPRFFGAVQLASADSTSSALNATLAAPPVGSFLHLADASAEFPRPSLMDVKIGAQSWDPFEVAAATAATAAAATTGSVASVAGIAKVAREQAKCPAQATTGFRICGARVWRSTAASGTASVSSHGSYESYGKQWCRLLPATVMDRPFWVWIGHSADSNAAECDASRPPTLAADAFQPSIAAMRTAQRVLPPLLTRLRLLQNLCEHAPLWRLYASSLLLCYDSGCGSDDDDSSPTAQPSVHLIDFAHAYPIHLPLPTETAIAHLFPADAEAVHEQKQPTRCRGACGRPAAMIDSNYLLGIRTLIDIFERMLQHANAALAV